MILDILDIFVGVLANILRIYVIKRWIDVLFDEKDYTWKVRKLLYVIFCFETSLIYNLYHLPLLNVLANIGGLALVIFPYKARLTKKILTISLIYGVIAVVDSLVMVTFANYFIGAYVNQIYGCIESLVLLTIVFIFEKTFHVEKDIQLPLLYQFALGVIPVISIGIIYVVVRSVPEMKGMILCVIVGFFIVNILIFYLYISLIQYYSAYIEKKMFEQLVDVYAYQLDLVRESQIKVKALRHDLKHHIIELKSMAQNNENSKMKVYLEEMEKFMLNPKEHVATGNQNVDGILNYLLQEADRLLNKVSTKINIPDQLFLNNFKVCAIVGNLVDNGIRAASQTEEKYLGVKIQVKQGVLLIFVENSYCGDIVKKNDRIQTTQKDMAIHGIGLENVKKIVETSGGEMRLDYDQKRFRAEVLLYISENREVDL